MSFHIFANKFCTNCMNHVHLTLIQFTDITPNIRCLVGYALCMYCRGRSTKIAYLTNQPIMNGWQNLTKKELVNGLVR